MKKQKTAVVSLFWAALFFVGAAGATAQAPEPRAFAENRELDRQALQAVRQLDAEKLMNLYFWNSPELVYVGPEGSVLKGWENIRRVHEQTFAVMKSFLVEYVDVSYVQAGDIILGSGTALAVIQAHVGPPQRSSHRFTDVRRRIGGRWVVVQRHAQGLAPEPLADVPLYKRLGGYDAIAAVVDDFIPRLAADPHLGRFFTGLSTDSAKRVRQLLVDQLCAATGGPCLYLGRDMKTAHAGMGITLADWDVLVNHLLATFDKFHVPQRERDELLSAIAGLKDQIVEK